MIIQCRNCKKEHVACRTSRATYCSITCQQEYQSSIKIKAWLRGELTLSETKSGTVKRFIRTWMLKQAGNKCSKCGWGELNPSTGKSPLEIDHIDGNHLNNSPENLRVLCPNCHSLTTTYKALNRGNGRPNRNT